MRSERILILSDDKPGHLNQSISFAKHKGFDYDICRVAFKNRLAKGFSYFADHCHFYKDWLFHAEKVNSDYCAVVSAGSETYYANRVLSKRLKIKSVAIMLPKGYSYDFDLIIAQRHDDPPEQKNILCLPINLTYPQPQGLVAPQHGEKYISFIIGGDSKRGVLDVDLLKEQLSQVVKSYPEHCFWLTTSRRTSAQVENMLRTFAWDQAVYYSDEPVNPIPDFMLHSDYLFLTSDSTSMISEAVSFGNASVEILQTSNVSNESGKLDKMLKELVKADAVHIFDKETGGSKQKFDLKKALSEVKF